MILRPGIGASRSRVSAPLSSNGAIISRSSPDQTGQGARSTVPFPIFCLAWIVCGRPAQTACSRAPFHDPALEVAFKLDFVPAIDRRSLILSAHAESISRCFGGMIPGVPRADLRARGLKRLMGSTLEDSAGLQYASSQCDFAQSSAVTNLPLMVGCSLLFWGRCVYFRARRSAGRNVCVSAFPTGASLGITATDDFPPFILRPCPTNSDQPRRVATPAIRSPLSRPQISMLAPVIHERCEPSSAIAHPAISTA